MWTKESVIERIFYWDEFRDFAADYHKVFNGENIRRKRVTRHAPFESPALDNAMFDEAFGQLTKTEQYLLIELYGKDSGVDIDHDRWNEEAIEKIKQETGMTLQGISIKVRYAIGCLLNYLNGGG
jgi:hypothetical protein